VTCKFPPFYNVSGLGEDMAMGLARVTNAQAMDSGEKRLAELGYKQELKRDLSYVNAHIASIYIHT
jgi:hypothetical protein